jgi:hypothetical protein
VITATTTTTHHHDKRRSTTMAAVESNDFSSPDEVRNPHELVTIEIVKIGGGEIGRYTFRPGWRWSEHVRPIVGGDACQVDHLGYVLSGRLGVLGADGETREIGAGEAYRIAPGHDGWVVGDEPAVAVEFQGAATYAKA